MWRRLAALSLAISAFCPLVWADTSTSDSTLSISPSATSGTTITAADENDRNNDTSTWANAHDHDLPNTILWGDGAAGDKYLCADAADATDRCLQWDDTNNLWRLDQITAASFNQIVTITGTAAAASRAVMMGTGDAGTIEASTMTLATSLPTTFGDFAARVYNDAAESISSGTATVITFNTERWDTDTIHSTSSNTGRLTATTAGRYQITGHAEFAADPDGYRRLEVLLNGATVIASTDAPPNILEGTAAVTRLSVSTHYNLAATDYVELRAFQNGASSLNVNVSGNYSPEFEMVKVP